MVTELPGAPPGPAKHPFSVLIADDDRGTRETLRDVLEDRGFKTVVAADGREAVEIVRIEFVHLILCDFQMPGMTGLEAVRTIREQIRHLLPAILMTADANAEVLRQAFLAQVYSVVPKPLNKTVVLHTMDRALAQVYGPPAPKPPTEETAK